MNPFIAICRGLSLFQSYKVHGLKVCVCCNLQCWVSPSMECGPLILNKSALHSFTWDGKWLLFTKSTLEYAYLYQRSIHKRVRMEMRGVWIIIRVIISVPFTNRQALTVAKCMAGNQVIIHAVVHSDCIFPYPLQCPGHKDIMWCLVSTSLHLRSSRQQDAWEPPSCVAVAVLPTNDISRSGPEIGHTHSYNCVHMLSFAAVHVVSACV